MLNEFNEHSIFWLLLTSVVSLVIAFITSLLSASVTTYFTFIATIGQERHKRIHDENMKWANPVIDAIRSLKSRLINVIEDDACQVFSSDYNNFDSHPNWSINYNYFFNSTLYLFAQYFAWSQMIREEISYELFNSRDRKKAVFDLFWAVSTALSEWDFAYQKKAESETVNHNQIDCQVFALQQKAIADLLIIREKDQKPRCMSYAEFEKNMRITSFRKHIKPLEKLINRLERDTFRWYRLKRTYEKLELVENECKKLFF